MIRQHFATVVFALGATVFATACGGANTAGPDSAINVDAASIPANPARGISRTELSVDVATLVATATITLEPSASAGATFEIGDIEVQSAVDSETSTALLWKDNGATLDVGVAASTQPIKIAIRYLMKKHTMFDGFTPSTAGGFTLVWPYFCGNLFPCHSRPDDGTEFSVTVNNAPPDQQVIAPAGIIAEAPSYQLAWAIGKYTEVDLGTTTAGTKITIHHLPGQAAAAQKGGANLRQAFDWLEKNIGAYRFGNHAGTVSVKWGPGALGGMEHHPLWHVADSALSDEETNVHEAAHGWYGDGIRIACWEDFVLSEGTVTYLAGRALDAVAPTVGAAVWRSYAQELPDIDGASPVWPQGCNQIDIIKDNLFSRAPYIRGAFFYRALSLKLGVTVVDNVLATFYREHAGKAAKMADMLSTITTVTGYDATACANSWLRSTTVPPVAACP
jgi:aminopeptidase N